MENRRRFLRFESEDFLEIRPLNEPAKSYKEKAYNFSPLGICFFSSYCWQPGQVLFVEYFIPEEMEPVKFKVNVVWSEFISEKKGFLVGAEIISLEEENSPLFINYYFRKIKERFFE